MTFDERSARPRDPRVTQLDPATLRRRAEQCWRLARSIPPGPNAETLRQIAREYEEEAERVERAPSVRAARGAHKRT
jgi:hypothetical protein